jgi:hypothetical protein
MADGADELRTAVDRLIGQVMYWTPPRWRAASGVFGRTRADLVHDLVQRIADLAADAEGQPRRTVPRLENDLALPDQLVVVTRDLLRASPEQPTMTVARGWVARTREAFTGNPALVHRESRDG